MATTSKILLMIGAAVAAAMVVVLLVTSMVLKHGVTQSVAPLLRVSGRIAANAVVAGVQLESKDEVAAALSAFQAEPLVTYLQVKDKQGNEVYLYRKTDLPEVSLTADVPLQEWHGESFETTTVETSGETIGSVTVGTSLAERDAALASARWITLGLALAAVAFVVFATRVYLAKTLQKPLRAAAAELRASAEKVSGGAAEISSASHSVAQGASQQAASLRQTSASTDEVGSRTRRNAENAGTVAGLMQETEQIVNSANESLGELVKSIGDINQSSGEIAKIIKVIDKIAVQTNMLSLNATVEAARAGEAGMGFAVVAEEVRSLAQRSAQAARDTTKLIEESISRANAANLKMQQVTKSMAANTSIATQVKLLVDEVNVGSQEQAHSMEQIAQAVTEMEQVTHQTASTAQQSAAAGDGLGAQAATLQDIVSRLTSLVGNV